MSSVPMFDEYYLEQGQGVFAIALASLRPGSRIMVLQENIPLNEEDEQQQDTKVILRHALCQWGDALYDVMGLRTSKDLVAAFNCGDDYNFTGFLTIEEFRQDYAAEIKDSPEMLMEAMQVIAAQKARYGL